MKNSNHSRHICTVVCFVAIVTACLVAGGLEAKGRGSSHMPGPESLGDYQQPVGSQSVAGAFQINGVFGGVGAEASPRVNKLINEAEEMAKRLESDVDLKVSSLKRSAEESIAKMKVDVEDRAVQLKRESDLEAQKVRQRAELQADKLFKQAAVQASEIAKKVEDEAVRLKKDAVYQVVNIINKAEEESLKLRRKAREQAILGRMNSRSSSAIQSPGIGGLESSAGLRPLDRYHAALPLRSSASGRESITHEWRQAMASEFNTNTLHMKQIITDGEDAEHLSDFLQRFNDQNTWFDRTLRGTLYVNDKNYHQVVNKQVRLRNIIRAQKKADMLLADVSKRLKLNDYEYKKIRLLSLYELNAFAQKELFRTVSVAQPGQKEMVSRRVKFTDQVVNYLVLRVANELTGRVKSSYPNFKILDDKAVVQLAVGVQLDELGLDVKKLRTMVDTTTQEKISVKKRSKQRAEEQGKELFEHQLSVKRLEAELERLRQHAATDKIRVVGETQDRAKREFGVRLEEKEKDCLDLTLQLTGATQKIDILDRQLKEAKDNFDRVNLELTMVKDEATVAKKHVGDLQREIEEQRKLKNMAYEKARLGEEVADRRIDEHVGNANKLVSVERREMKKLEGSLKDKEESLKRAERDLQDKERLLSKKEREVEDQRTLFEEVRESIKASARAVTEAAQRETLKAELRWKKQDQAVVSQPEIVKPPVPVAKSPEQTNTPLLDTAKNVSGGVDVLAPSAGAMPVAAAVPLPQQPPTAPAQPATIGTSTAVGMPIAVSENEKRKELEKELSGITKKVT